MLSNVTLTKFQDPNSAISYSLAPVGPTYQDQNGGIILTLKLPENIPSQAGVGKVATLNFTVNKINVAINSTKVTILPLTNFLLNKGDNPIKVTRNELLINFGTPASSPAAK